MVSAKRCIIAGSALTAFVVAATAGGCGAAFARGSAGESPDAACEERLAGIFPRALGAALEGYPPGLPVVDLASFRTAGMLYCSSPLSGLDVRGLLGEFGGVRDMPGRNFRRADGTHVRIDALYNVGETTRVVIRVISGHGPDGTVDLVQFEIDLRRVHGAYEVASRRALLVT